MSGVNPRPTSRAERVGPRATKGPRRGRCSRLARFAVGVAVLALVGSTIQAAAARRDAAAHPPAGQLVELADGRSLHVQVAGEEHDGPVVVLETGLGGFSAAWAWVQPLVAEHATVVAYDRAGLGRSDRSDTPPGGDRVVDDLRTALARLGLDDRGYVLVGHSLGAHYVRTFARAHPDEVLGMVLVDPSHERQVEVVGSSVDPGGLASRIVLAAMQGAARVGLLRLWDPFASVLAELPEGARERAEAAQVTPDHWRAYRAEARAMNDIAGELADAHDGELGDIPLTVLIAGHPSNATERGTVDAMAQLREDLAGLSRSGRTVLAPDADHLSVVTDRQHATVVADAIIDVLDDAIGRITTGAVR